MPSETGDGDVKVKDFKDLTAEDLTKLQVVAVKGSHVSLSKKRTSSTLSAAKEKSKTRRLGESDSISIGSKTKRKSSDRLERAKRGSRSPTRTSSATLTTIVYIAYYRIHQGIPLRHR